MKRRILSLVIAIALVLAMLPVATPAAQAVTTSSYAPYAKIQYEYSTDVECGTIRYISQLESSQYFNWDYWPSAPFGYYSAPISECGTSCLSMALSYVGINLTPSDILHGNTAEPGRTAWDLWAAEYHGYGSNIASAINTTFSNYLNGNGKYSPPVIHLTIGSSYSGATDPGHFVLIIGQTSSNTWQILDPANNAIENLTINGVSLTYKGVNQKVNQIHQWYNSNANICSHPSYDSLGICTSCGAEFDWESTFNTGLIGTYKVTSSFTPRTDKPYDAAAKADYSIDLGERVEVLAHYKNAFGNTWYKFLYNGQIGYVYESYLEYEGIAPLRVTCSDFSPANQTVLEKKAQPVIGTVISNYPLTTIYAYLDGEHYATWNAGNNYTTRVSLRETDINYALPFGSLSDGKHTIELIAHSFAHDKGVSFHSSVFYINQKTDEDTRPGKPTLNVSVNQDFVTFTWSATTNTTHYNLWLAKQNGDAEWEEVEQIFYAENGLSRSLEAGEYRAQLLSYNSNAWESDNSDWQHTWADDVFFTIEADIYTVTFNAMGGTSVPSDQTVQCGDAVTLPSVVPEYFGRNFKGWSVTADATSADFQPNDTFQPGGDITLYAVWEDVYTLGAQGHYFCDSVITYPGTGWYYRFVPAVSTYYRLYGTGETDTRVHLYDEDGYQLATDDDSGYSYQFALEHYLVAGQVYYIYVCFWSSTITGTLNYEIARGYQINYDANGGIGADSSFIKYDHIDATLSSIVPMRDGYTFLGWATVSNATTAIYQPGESFTYNADTTLYAVWENDCESNGHNYCYTISHEPNQSTDGLLLGVCSKCSGTTVVTLPKLNTTDYSYEVKTEPSYSAMGVGCYTWKNTTYGLISFDVVLDKLAATGIIDVRDASAAPGTMISLTVEMINNPGFAYLAVTPVYDTSVLTLVSVENGEIIEDFDSGDNFAWSTSEETTAHGILLRLTFKVSEDAVPGDCTVKLVFREAYTLMGEDVYFEIQDGTVTVSDTLYGDANGDGTVNGKDVLLLRRYMAYYNYDTGTSTVEIFPGGDANGDGVVNGKDVLLMRRYMAYYNYDTGTSSVVLGPA